jgi:OOP family OmpA-OmpF porin
MTALSENNMTRKQIHIGRFSGQFSLLTLAFLASSHAMADNPSWYFGANIGQAQVTIDDARISSGMVANGLVVGPINDIHRDLGFKIFGGYQFNKNFALEGGYFNLGQFGFNTSTVPLGTLSGDVRVKGVNLDAVGTLPITNKFSIFGHLGVTYTQTSDAFVGTGAVNVFNPNPSSRDTNFKIGLGLQYALTDALTLRTEIERYRIDDAVGNKGDVDLVSVGLIYRFGGKTPTPVARIFSSESVVLPPAPHANAGSCQCDPLGRLAV